MPERIRSRNNGRGGFLDAEALRGGLREQWAAVRGTGTVVVELRHDGSAAKACWHVTERITDAGATTSNDEAFTTLDEARREYRRLVRHHR